MFFLGNSAKQLMGLLKKKQSNKWEEEEEEEVQLVRWTHLAFSQHPGFLSDVAPWGGPADWLCELQAECVCVFSLMIHQLVTQRQQSPKHLVIRLRCSGWEQVTDLLFQGTGGRGGCKKTGFRWTSITSRLRFQQCSVCFSHRSNRLLCGGPGEGLWQTVPVVLPPPVPWL